MKTITENNFLCPECGKHIPDELIAKIKAAGVFEFRSKVGSTMTEKKKRSCQDHIAKVNAGYTPEKRRAAAAKRKANKE